MANVSLKKSNDKEAASLTDIIGPTDAEYLQAIFGDEWGNVHVTAFLDDPTNISKDRRGICWGGRYYLDQSRNAPTWKDKTNRYFCISLFNRDDEGKPRRRKNLFKAMYCVVADDVKDKIPQELAEKLPPPSWKLETSPGNEQWGWILTAPESDRNRAENLLDGLVANGLAPDGRDPGMKGVTRYVRLPQGWNSKAKYVEKLGEPFKCKMIEWHPQHRTSIEQLAEPFDVDLDANRVDKNNKEGTSLKGHPVMEKLVVIREKREGEYDIICPWVEEHTDYDDSGTWIKTNEDGSIAFKCHHGYCQNFTGKDLLEKLDLTNELDRWRTERQFPILKSNDGKPVLEDDHIDNYEINQSNQDISEDNLPTFCPELIDLPFELGRLQDYVYKQMIYPSRATAGLTAFSALGNYAMHNLILDSYGGLGFNEYHVVLGSTTFGKENLRKAIQNMDDSMVFPPDGCQIPDWPAIQYQTPASPQGLHLQLQANRSQLYMGDEFAEWLTSSRSNDCRQQTVAYFMELYTKATSKVNVPAAAHTKYTPVSNPRVGIFATTTGERLTEALTTSQADSGTYNRLIIHVAELDRIEKQYEGLKFEVDHAVIDLITWIMNLKHQGVERVTFSSDAWAYYKEFDREVIEPIKFHDRQLGGRLSEQALKYAGLIALSDRRTVISKSDLETAYKIRLNLYYRAKAYFFKEGALTGNDPSVVAYDQCARLIRSHKKIPLSRLSTSSRRYRSLDHTARTRVVDSLVKDGIAERKRVSGGVVLLYTGGIDD